MASANSQDGVFIGGGIVRITRDYGGSNPYVFLLCRLGSASGISNGTAKALSGQWSKPPVAAVGLTSMGTYDPAYLTQDQEINAEIDSVDHAGSGVYNITATARLVTYGGMYVWNANESWKGMVRTHWTQAISDSVYTSAIFYGSDIAVVSFDINLWSYQSAPAEYTQYERKATVYIRYLNSAGTWVEQSIRSTTEEIYGWIQMSIRASLGSVASQVQVKVVFTTLGTTADPTYHSYANWDAVQFKGGICYRSDGAASRVTLYSGTLQAIAVGR